ncbi:MAG TPA: ribonuclease H-like domain-containing protein [Acidobacteriota bacterium]|jgi:DEAD/DEAH box helicase domain-containing protein|nr:ribonuclease H-like domain-containing protein [Acidobacteriota bacterium]HNU00495.1 ribonuclease H-like domain-containing protein [Acidobacteriota bacterium]HPB27350.1 ribonuclease H-like domain-containing protein [Acidobacteriota bacterium]HQO26063.1 ribonuclease H-like domain-containing protein [Acidobacteriota bacterium]HQP74677.1 ribonuclease H-like domain-containing protein [Acidobacteriota bacterium]
MTSQQRSLFGPAEREVVFDLETQRSFQEVGGKQNIHQLKLSLAVLYDYSTGEFTIFREAEADRLVDELLAATRVIGFNIKNFDYAVLRGYRADVDFRQLGAKKTLDLLEKIAQQWGFRVSLDSIAKATLGRGKSGQGLDALRWYKEGRFDLIERYCRDDVDITRQVFEFGRDRGHLKYLDRFGEIRTSPVDWNR